MQIVFIRVFDLNSILWTTELGNNNILIRDIPNKHYQTTITKNPFYYVAFVGFLSFYLPYFRQVLWLFLRHSCHIFVFHLIQSIICILGVCALWVQAIRRQPTNSNYCYIIRNACHQWHYRCVVVNAFYLLYASQSDAHTNTHIDPKTMVPMHGTQCVFVPRHKWTANGERRDNNLWLYGLRNLVQWCLLGSMNETAERSQIAHYLERK